MEDLMASVNRVMILGNLGHTPELRHTAGGTAVTNLSVATSHVTKERDGSSRETTEWHKVVVWGRQAEVCAEHLTKGRSVLVEGRLQTRAWESQPGVKAYATEIVAAHVHFLGQQVADALARAYEDEPEAMAGEPLPPPHTLDDGAVARAPTGPRPTTAPQRPHLATPAQRSASPTRASTPPSKAARSTPNLESEIPF
jgi:single-strand DNA-binding protein